MEEDVGLTEPTFKLPNGTHIAIIRKSEGEDEDEDLLEEYMEIVSVKCRLCDYSSQSKRDLRRHLSECHLRRGERDMIKGRESSVYLCAHCSAGFPDKDLCKAHMQKEHELVAKPPRKPDDRTLKKCPECCYRFKTKDFEIHSLCHCRSEEEEEASSSFKCFFCGECFAKWGPCANHLWKAHQRDTGLLTCKICGSYRTFHGKSMENHSKIHSEERLYSCEKCLKSFKQLAQLKNHSVIHLNKEKDKVPPWYSKKQCELCDKLFSDSKCLKKHVQAVHSKLKPYICQVCNHQTSRKAMLDMHMRQHTGEKPYKCEVCPYKTGDHNSLRRHKLRHSGLKPHKCSYCDYASIQSSALQKHLLTKHPSVKKEEPDQIIIEIS